jgi:P-type Ca2+ transporter type 2C
MTADGLTPEQVVSSRAAHGDNVLTPPKREPWWRQYLAKFDDPVIRILMIAAAVAVAVGAMEGHYAEGIGIILAVLLSTGLAFVNEFRAAREFDILNRTSDDVPVTVRRAGNFTTVPRRDVVVGDIVQIEVGAEIPADGKLIEAVGLKVNESRLTGESRPSDKHLDPVHHDESAYSADHLLRGTTVVDGYGLFEVTAVGDGTQIGQTARAAAEDTGTETPLNRQLVRLSQWIGVIGFGVSLLTFIALVTRDVLTVALPLTGQQWSVVAVAGIGINVALVRVWLPIVFDGLNLCGLKANRPAWLVSGGVRGWLTTAGLGAGVIVVCAVLGWLFGGWPARPTEWLPVSAVNAFLEYFMIAVTIVVVAVPEGLAMSVTLSLAYSMRKMTASNCLVRRLHACETIGAATVICSDKTGTLTMNEMRVAAAELNGPQELIAEAIAANSTAQLDRSGDVNTPVGNPTEGALLLWLADRGVDYQPIRDAFVTAEQWTFSTERKFMATRGRSLILGKNVIYLKGAPEVVLERCAKVESSHAVQQKLRDYQSRGMRTLGLAYAEIGDGPAELDHLARNLTWLGFVAIADPVRPEVPGAIAACGLAGVAVKIVTGDNSDTAKEIARQIGLWGEGEPVSAHCTGPDFEAMSDDDAARAAKELKILSRARPADKLRLVRLLQKQNEVVAVTGDGVNDAPALNYANVGLAMGKTGSAVAKEASDIILLDDSFQSIVNAVMWGRSLYENIQRFVLFQLTINVAALALAFLGPFLGFQLPLTVMQMLWINLIMDTFAALALATEPPSPAVLDRPPRDPKAFIVTPTMARNIFGTASLFLAILVGLILTLRHSGTLPSDNTPSRGSSILFCVFVFLQFWNLFNARCLGSTHSAFVGLKNNLAFLTIVAAIFVGQVLMVQFGGPVFRTVPLGWPDWLLIVFGTSLVLVVGEFIRWHYRKPTLL